MTSRHFLKKMFLKQALHDLSGEIQHTHTALRKKKKQKTSTYRALEVDMAVPLLRDPLMGQLTHPVRLLKQ